MLLLATVSSVAVGFSVYQKTDRGRTGTENIHSHLGTAVCWGWLFPPSTLEPPVLLPTPRAAGRVTWRERSLRLCGVCRALQGGGGGLAFRPLLLTFPPHSCSHCRPPRLTASRSVTGGARPSLKCGLCTSPFFTPPFTP